MAVIEEIVARCRKSWVSYLAANLSSMLPVAATSLVVVVAMETTFVAHPDCKSRDGSSVLQTNPVLCPNATVMHRVFDNRTLPVELTGWPSLTGARKAELTSREGARAALQKDLDDAAAELQEAKRKRELLANATPKADPKPQRPGATLHSHGKAHSVRMNPPVQPAVNPTSPASKTDMDKSRAEAETKVAEAATKRTVAEHKLADFDKAVKLPPSPPSCAKRRRACCGSVALA